MSIIKTIKDALILISFLVAAILTFQYFSASRVGVLFAPYTDYNIQALEKQIILFIFSLIGTYYYFAKNIWINFRSLTVRYVFLGCTMLLFFTSTYLYAVCGKLSEVIHSMYHEIPFPTTSDDVERNIKLSIISNAQNFLLSSLFIGLLGLIVGNYQLIQSVKKKRTITNPNKTEN